MSDGDVTRTCRWCHQPFTIPAHRVARLAMLHPGRPLPTHCGACLHWQRLPKAARGIAPRLRDRLEREWVARFLTGDPLAAPIEDALATNAQAPARRVARRLEASRDGV